MIPYGRQDIFQADIDAVVEVLRSDWFTKSLMVPRFEEAVTVYAGAQHAVVVNSASVRCTSPAWRSMPTSATGYGPTAARQ